MMESPGVSQFTDKLDSRRLQGTGMKPLDSATLYPAHAVARRKWHEEGQIRTHPEESVPRTI
jgi:hypothetical protein